MFIDKELRKDDWSGLVVHFPGIDHLAHMGGAHSPYMHNKQQEMDDVVNNVYRSIQKSSHLNKTLLVLLGDHGMNDLGEHGGNTVAELSTALLFISPHLKALPSIRDEDGIEAETDRPYHYFSSVSQLDIVPTISGLLGLPIPRDNLGSFIPDFLPLWKTIDERRSLILQNLIQLKHGAAIEEDYHDCENNLLTTECLQKHIDASSRGGNLADEVSLLSKVIINPNIQPARK
jgi:ethanolaminephosphotransferase